MDGKKVLEIFDKMSIERGNMSSLWSDSVRYCMPYERSSYDEFGSNDTTPGKRRASPVCSYPVIYANRLASSLHNSVFPTNSYWADFDFGDDRSIVRDWCRKARDKVHFKLRSGTNFYQESHAMMHGLAVLGTSGFYTYYKRGKLHFRYIPVHKNFYIAKNSDGEIDMVAILHEYTAKEAIEEFGDAVSDRVKNALYQGVEGVDKFNFVQLVYPKRPYGEKYDLLKGEKPYGDVIVDKETGHVVREGGHTYFPFAVPRFYVASDDLYGRSPAMTAMSDIKSANMLRRNILEASLRAIKPAIFINSLVGAPISIASGAVNRIPNFDPNSIWTYPVPTDYPIGKDQMIELQEALIKAFYIDVFQAVDQQGTMTATEVTERVRQKVEAISSVVGRIQKEFAEPVIMQCLYLLIENGELEPPPVDVDWGMFNISYISGMDAMIQQGVAAQTMTFIMQAESVGQALANNPDIGNVINVDNLLVRLADCAMLPGNYIRSEDERNARREMQAAQAQGMQQAEADERQSVTMLNLAKADAVKKGQGYNGLKD